MLTKNEIRNLIQSGKPPLVTDYLNLEEQLQPNGFDCTLMTVEAIEGSGQIGDNNTKRILPALRKLPYDEDGFVFLPQGVYVITYNEIVTLPKTISSLGNERSSLLRCGVFVKDAVGDAGYSGRFKNLLMVHNPSGFRVQKNARLLQMVFFYLSAETEGYSGIYQNLKS